MACAAPGGAGRKTQRVWALLCLRGLLGPGERKSLQPMAARLELPGPDQLQHFIASTAWDDSAAWTVLAREADRLLGGAGQGSRATARGMPAEGGRAPPW